MRARTYIRSLCSSLIVLFVIGQVVFGAGPVSAVFPVSEVTKPVEKLELNLRESLMSSLMGSVISASSFFVRKIAHDTAVAFASAGNGQDPLIITDPLKWGESVAAGTVGEAVGEFGKPFGLNLCRPPSINVQLFVQLGIRDIYGTGNPTPECNWQTFDDIGDAWGPDAFSKTYGPELAKFSDLKFNDVVSVRNSDFGVTMGAIAKVDQLQAAAKSAALLQQQIGENIKDVTSQISGQTITPAVELRKELELTSVKQQVDYSNEQIAGFYATQFPNLIPTAINVFLGTFASTLMERLLNQGLVPANPSAFSLNYFSGGPVLSASDAAARAFNFLLTPTISDQDNYDIIGQFASCPPNPGLNNCVIDQQFANVLRQAKSTGKPLTIAEAMEKNYLDPNKPLISWRRTADNTNIRNCYTTGYCYSNIQKLRKARILPLGFEIAAQKLPPDQRPVTLGEIVAHFDDCDPTGLPTSAHPYCHLINPNWILKAPDARCETLAIGPQLVDQNSALRRSDECVDLSTCVVENPDGTCAGVYGFCTKEKNVWRLSGQSCQPQYSSCTTFRGPQGTASYLRRTLDASSCNENSVGCLAYSLNPIDVSASTWHSSAEVDLALKATGFDNQVIHFNDAIGTQTCDERGVGCRALYGGLIDVKTAEYFTDSQGHFVIDTNNPLYIKKAPDYLGCYDTDRSSAHPEPNWPVVGADLALVNQDTACNAYARVCVRDEVGCDSYARVDDPNAPHIPAIIGGNSCPNSCVGYDAFREEATLFAPTTSVQYLVPDSVLGTNRCSLSEVGCTEFTNIDEAARGGEALEYYTDLQYCEKPNGTNEGVYYSWEGSVEQGYRLETHHLLRVSDTANRDITRLGVQYAGNDTVQTVFAVGSPAYARTMKSELQSFYRSCNADVYSGALANLTATGIFNANCRALYDETGNIYYRILSEVAQVSTACHPLRKTTTFLVTDPDVTALTNSDPTVVNGQNFCQEQGGNWSDDPDDSVSTAVCRRCANGGRYDGGACVYNTTSQPGGAFSCRATANGCRKYVGTTGGNVHANVIFKTFEPTSVGPNALIDVAAGWGPTTNPGVRVVSESLTVGQYSLLLESGEDSFSYRLNKIQGEAVTSSGWYELSFWARGDANAMSVYFSQNGPNVGNFTVNPVTGASTPVRISPIWQSYTLGQVQFTGNGDDEVDLNFVKASAASGVFIDNVRLTWVPNELLAVKDSWRTPRECDSTPNDNLPGEMLGCKAYTNSAGQGVNATGFARLCREAAVGCMPVVDSMNTLSGAHPTWARAYNVWCAVIGLNTCTLHIDNGIDAPVDVSCPVLAGNTGCYINTPVELPNGYTLPTSAVTASTIVIPADTVTTTPIYLTNTPAVQCSASQLGCMRVGTESRVLPTQNSTFTYTNTFILNQPDAYIGAGGNRGTLCTDEAVSCSRFTSDDGVSYFKDPTLNGKSTCSYKSVQTPTGSATGWFLDGIGLCSNNTAAYCRVDGDCGAGNTCTLATIGNQPCYPGYQHVQNGTIIYDLWSNDSVGNYTGLVGTCPATENSCVELIDPVDSSDTHPRGQSYYALFNNDLKTKSALCNGQVSLQSGCVLFQKTDDPHTQFDAAATYAVSARATPPNSLVSPVVTANNTANVILKVDRDRACDEWLSCKSSFPEKQPDGSVKNLCYDFKSCTAAEVATDPGGRCTERPATNFGSASRLTEGNYISRGTDWYGQEYAGYALFNKYQINDLKYVSFDVTDYITLHASALTTEERTALDDVRNHLYLVYDRPNVADECENQADWQSCGQPDNGGRCYANRCVYRIDGAFPIDLNGNTNPLPIIDTLTTGSCKAYPESDSPFPRSVTEVPNTPAPTPIAPTVNQTVSRQEFVSRKSGFGGANICQNGDCSCGYIRTEYKNGTKDFWPVAAATPIGICLGGDHEGAACAVDVDCGNSPNVTCSKIVSKKTNVGLEGFCLEPDYSRPINGATTHAEDQQFACLTWLPIDVSASNIDIANHVQTAGYFPPLDANTNPSTDNGAGVTGQIYCSAATGLGGHLDQSSNGSINELTVSAWENTYFTNASPWFDGTTGLPTDGRSTAVVQVTPNVAGRPEIPAIYGMMQAWAWHVLGGNATVLRVENGFRGGVQVAGPNLLGAGCISTTQLPGVNSTYRLANTCAGNSTNNGTIMHPPRVWGDTNAVRRLGLIAETARVGFFANRPSTVSGFPYAPYPEFDTDVTATTDVGTIENPFTQILHRFPAETNLHAADLKRVYFVPMDIANQLNGGSNVYPEVFANSDDSGLYIDFAALDVSDRSAIFRTGVHGSYVDFVSGNSSPQTLASVWTYRLDATTDYGTQTLNHYNGEDDPTTNPNIAYYTGSSDPSLRDSHGNARNRIARRYVMVLGGTPNNTPPVPFFGNLDQGTVRPPSTHEEDPFYTVGHCEVGDHWYAVGMDFNSDGEFLGYITRRCRALGVSPLAVVATLADQCTQLAQVYDESQVAGSGSTNKAWTDRVWQFAHSSDHTLTELIHPIFGNQFLRNVLNLPFGSTRLQSADMVSTNYGARNYTFRYTTAQGAMAPDGVPYSCSAPTWRGIRIVTANQCAPTTAQAAVISGRNDALSAVDQLFARTFVYGNVDSVGNLTLDTTHPRDRASDTTLGLSSGTPIPLRPPQIYSLNLANCFETTGSNRRCTAGEENNFTIGQRNSTLNNYDRDRAGAADEDRDGNGVVDPYIKVGTETANMQFFAFADDNRMPLRRIMVDWGDGSTITNENRYGLYRNRKPFCASADTAERGSIGICGTSPTNLTGITCHGLATDCPADEDALGRTITYQCYGDIQLNGTVDNVRSEQYADSAQYTSARFGNAPRACTTEPFQFLHDYTCSQSDIDADAINDISYVIQVDQIRNPDARAQLTGTYHLTNTDKVCVFQPRVQVLDNWGWCNGSCVGQANGCYNGATEGVLNNVQQCNIGAGSPNDNPWTNYQGQIIVVPQRSN